MELRLAVVAPGACDTLNEIHAVMPRTMSWSNLADFISPADYFAMVCRCSRPSDAVHPTVHYAHSMNWIRDIKV